MKQKENILNIKHKLWRGEKKDQNQKDIFEKDEWVTHVRKTKGIKIIQLQELWKPNAAKKQISAVAGEEGKSDNMSLEFLRRRIKSKNKKGRDRWERNIVNSWKIRVM